MYIQKRCKFQDDAKIDIISKVYEKMVSYRDFLYLQVIAVLLSAPKCYYARFEMMSDWLISKENLEH